MFRCACWKRLGSLTCLVTTIVLMSGCGGSVNPKVTGKITLAGVPVKQGTVMFVPEGNGQPATGELTADGSFTMYTTNLGDGVAPGKYLVSITAIELTNEALPDAPAAALPKMLIPERYNNHTTSKLTFEVGSGKDNVANFDLTK